MVRSLIPLLAGLLLLGAFAASTYSQTNYQRLRSFGFPEVMGARARTTPLDGSDGKLYGTVDLGGGNLATDGGGIFTVDKDGKGYRLIHRFGSSDADDKDSSNLPAPIIEASDGALYGVTTFGGAHDLGTVFRLNKDGSGFAVLHEFSGGNSDGSYP